MIEVEYQSNNSGGGWWLTDENWKALEDEGWAVDWVPDRWLGALATTAKKKFNNPYDAISEFERITGQDASAEGCNCCGEPHNFSYSDEDGKIHYTAVRVRETEIKFD